MDKKKNTPEETSPSALAPDSNDPFDINANLGSFGTQKETTPTTEVVVEDKILEQVELSKQNVTENKLSTDDKNAKIDFEKFSRTKTTRVLSKFGQKFDSWLRRPKTLLFVWLVAFGVITILWATQITYVVFVTHILKSNGPGPIDLSWMRPTGRAGNVLSYISIGLPVIPFFVLLVTFIIGINGMLSSRGFHYFLWFILIVAFSLFITSTICEGIVMDHFYSFHCEPKTS